MSIDWPRARSHVTTGWSVSHGGVFQALPLGVRAVAALVGAGVCGAVGSQDAGHLLVQVLQGLKQAGQHELVVVLVMQLCRPHAQHIAVVVSKELPQAAHILVLGLVTVLVCQSGGRR